MSVVRYGVPALLVALLIYSVVLKLSGRPDVVAAYARVGVERRQLPVLAGILLVGAAGVGLGLLWPELGLAAAAGLVGYFVLAIAAHARHHDLAHAVPPSIILLLAGGTALVFGHSL